MIYFILINSVIPKYNLNLSRVYSDLCENSTVVSENLPKMNNLENFYNSKLIYRLCIVFSRTRKRVPIMALHILILHSGPVSCPAEICGCLT